jgi:Ca-activated chloride channel family protein
LFLRPERTAEHQEEIQSQPISTVVKSENAERDSVIADTGRPDDVIVAGGESFYRRNNVVFLIDVSQSMAGMGKMDLLKASMSELVDELREIDNVSVVTYASDAKLVLPQTDGSKKEYILNTINALFAGGMTSGTRGFRMAYETAAKGYIEEGNNQVIVVTDGAFRASDNPMIVEMAQKQLQKGVKTSIVGIKSKPLAIISLTEIASWGGGNFVSINNLDQASEALLKEVRQQSAR